MSAIRLKSTLRQRFPACSTHLLRDASIYHIHASASRVSVPQVRHSQSAFVRDPSWESSFRPTHASSVSYSNIITEWLSKDAISPPQPNVLSKSQGVFHEHGRLRLFCITSLQHRLEAQQRYQRVFTDSFDLVRTSLSFFKVQLVAFLGSSIRLVKPYSQLYQVSIKEEGKASSDSNDAEVNSSRENSPHNFLSAVRTQERIVSKVLHLLATIVQPKVISSNLPSEQHTIAGISEAVIGPRHFLSEKAVVRYTNRGTTQVDQEEIQGYHRQLQQNTRLEEHRDRQKATTTRSDSSDHRIQNFLLCDSIKDSMSSAGPDSSSTSNIPQAGAAHRPLVVGLTKPKATNQTANMSTSEQAAELNKEIEKNVKSNVSEAGPTEDNPTAPASQKPKKEKAPKQAKQPKGGAAAAPPAPTSPALIDLRVGHILRAVAHPNADSLYVSTIAMGDAEGTEHTQVDEETGKVVRTVCSGLRGLIPLEEMQDRKIVVVANLKPVNMRSIKSAAMVLAASPRVAEGEDDHSPDRTVELVEPPAGSEAGDKVYFESWPYGEGKGPEKQLNPKKKQWEAIQPGFYTTETLEVAFDASKCEEVEGSGKGNLVVEGKGICKVKTLKDAVVR